MATKIAHGWIRKGTDKLVPQTASRTRVNVMGAIELSTMEVTSFCPEKVNTETTIAFFDQLKGVYPQASTLHIILDQAGYHRSEETQHAAKERAGLPNNKYLQINRLAGIFLFLSYEKRYIEELV